MKRTVLSWRMWLGATILSSACREPMTSVGNPDAAGWLTESAASASLVPTGDSVVSSLTIINSGATTKSVQFAPCTYYGPLSLRAYAAGATKPAWDSALDDNAACFTSSELVSLNPGASHTFRQVNAIGEILGDSLPAGEYIFTVSGRYLTPSDTTQLVRSSLTLANPTASAPAATITTDQRRYVATASGTAPYMRYAVTVIATYANSGSAPMDLEGCGSPFSYYVVGAGNHTGQSSAFSPIWACAGGVPPVVVAPGAVRVDTLRLNGPSATQADGTPLGPLNGQVQLVYRAGTGCGNGQQPCVAQASNIFAIQVPQ